MCKWLVWLLLVRAQGFRRRDDRIRELEAMLNDMGSNQGEQTAKLEQDLANERQAAERLREELSKVLAQLEIMVCLSAHRRCSDACAA